MNTNNPHMQKQQNPPRPTPEVAQRIEELLREQLYELGINVKELDPNDIAKHMKCHVGPNNSMTYFWKEEMILDIVPEPKDGSITWRMFTKDDIVPP